MSFTVDQNFKAEYSDSIRLLYQQKGSVLRAGCRVEPMQGEKLFFDRLAKDDSVAPLATIHAPTPLV